MPVARRRTVMLTAALFTAVLAACGGGGGSSAATTTATETATAPPPAAVAPPAAKPGTAVSSPTDSGVSTGPALRMGADAFYFAPDEAHTDVPAIEAATGGKLFTAWNPNDPTRSLQPGMKVMFFGAAAGCPGAHNGALEPLSDAALQRTAELTGLDASRAEGSTRWTPSGDSDGCGDSARSRDGASAVFLNPAKDGSIGLFTTSGQQDDGEEAFFGPYDASGQNGAGTNAHITGSFVNFRQAWGRGDAVHPWSGSAKARVRSLQSLGASSVDAATGGVAQGKQQMMATFINSDCAAKLLNTGKPCQIQYLFNTAIVRSGVSDWSRVSWFQQGGVWFDPAQGGIPIVDGPIKRADEVTLDEATGLGLFTSQGSASQHDSFKSRTFDVTIDFAQLMNAVRATVALSLQVDVSKVSDSDVAAMWGRAWNDRDSWVLLSSFVGQEVYNPDAARRVQIAGGFRDLYVGAQP
jgi:hypothetical protein